MLISNLNKGDIVKIISIGDPSYQDYVGKVAKVKSIELDATGRGIRITLTESNRNEIMIFTSEDKWQKLGSTDIIQILNQK